MVAKRLPIFLVMLAAVVGLAACESAPRAVPHFAPLNFSGEPPINLDVASIQVIDRASAAPVPGDVRQFFPISLTEAVRSWARQRLHAVGSQNTARVIIESASAVGKRIENAQGMRGFFGTGPAEQYKVELRVRLEIRNDRGFQAAAASAMAVRTTTAQADVTPADQKEIFYTMTKEMMGDINGEMVKNIHTFMPRYLR